MIVLDLSSLGAIFEEAVIEEKHSFDWKKAKTEPISLVTENNFNEYIIVRVIDLIGVTSCYSSE